jgi:nitrous oxidase accessory protein NosD
MHKIWTRLAIAAAAVTTVAATPALAQATRTWVSGVGDDVNPCSRTAPCKTFAGAISKTAEGGEINVLDPGGFGGLTITKSITIRADGDNGGVLVGVSSSGFIVNAAPTAKFPGGARVVIDGLDFDGTDSAITGVRILQARDVVIRNTSIRNFATAGVDVNGAASISVDIDNCFIFNNGVGVLVHNTGGAGTARIFNSNLVSNNAAGVRVDGAINKAELSANQVIRSPLGLDSVNSGVINSYGDNVLTTGDAPTIIPKG